VLPSPPSRAIGRIACTQNFPHSCLCLPGILNDAFCCECGCSGGTRAAPNLNGPGNFGKLPLPIGGSPLPSNTWFLRPTRVFIPNGMSIGSVFLHSSPQSVPLLNNVQLCVPQNCPFLLGDRVPHLTHSTYGLPESSSQIASQSAEPFLYGSQMLCCTMHCQWGKNPQNCPFLPLGILSPCQRMTEPLT